MRAGSFKDRERLVHSGVQKNVELETVELAHWLGFCLEADTELTFRICRISRLIDGWEVGPRRLDESLIYMVVSGEITGTIDESPVAVPAGWAFWLPPGVEHQFRLGRKDTESALIHLRFTLEKGERQLVCDTSQAPQAVGLRCFDLADEVLGHHAGGGLIGQHSLRAAFALLSKALGESSEIEPISGCLTPRQKSLIYARLAASEGRRLDVRDLAETVALSQDYFSRLFKRTFGVSPRSWLLNERLRQGGNMLLESNASVSEIAFELGYGDVFLFSKQFKERYGVSPRGYRMRR